MTRLTRHKTEHFELLLQNGYPAGVVNYNINDVLNRKQNKPKNPTTTVPKKKTILVLPYLGVQSKIVTKQLKICMNKFYGCIDLRVIFQSARRIKSFFPYKDKINRSQMSKVVCKASCWNCQDFYIGKMKRRLHDRKTEHFKGVTSTCHASAIADHVTSTGHILKWDHFEILAKGRSDTHCKIKGDSAQNTGTQTYPKRYCQQRKALSVLGCIYIIYLFITQHFCQLLSLLLLVTYFKFKFSC